MRNKLQKYNYEYKTKYGLQEIIYEYLSHSEWYVLTFENIHIMYKNKRFNILYEVYVLFNFICLFYLWLLIFYFLHGTRFYKISRSIYIDERVEVYLFGYDMTQDLHLCVLIANTSTNSWNFARV